MEDETQRIRRQMSEAFTEEQVAVLRSLRAELSNRRWQIMLEIDAAQEELRAALRLAGGPHLTRSLQGVEARLKRVHEDLARIPEDLIPAF